ncbi:cation-translocating P-type ATPase [Panacibacter ginsenosidivorans]|uniref:Cation-translocating P-type ATPase n=2 Tax=Panacibacter ginsenosidivorans TaxID=1813871 RepID=A0A5B8VHK7_9BACT|nr:cation-translocating P-type ATPase [Panacibacter ginsenosidivorans]
MNWHLEDIDKVLEITGSSKEGLSTTEAGKRLLEYGPNEITQVHRRSAWLLLLQQFKDFMILILVVAAIISGLLGDVTDTLVIVAIVILNAVIGFIQEYRAEKAMESLRKMTATNVQVFRDNTILSMPSDILVPGDIILLEAGNILPADIRLIEAVQVKVNEASLTGESLPVEKQTDTLNAQVLPLGDYTNMAFKGTFVTGGRGKGVVIATGMNTELGKVARLLQQPEVQTPLQKRLASFGRNLAYIILFICFVVFAIGFLKGEDVILMLMTSLSLAVAAIPEALPAVITIALAIGAKKMVRKNVLIRKLPAVETLGSVTYICTDKTGTLTLNKMTVEEIAGNDFSIYDNCNTSEKYSGNEYRLLMLAMALNNDVYRDKDNNLIGDPTEIALFEFASAAGYDKTKMEKQYPRVAEIPFDSKRKCMTTIHRYGDEFIAFTKGATEVLLQKIKDPSSVEKWQKPLDNMTGKGLRVLGFATRKFDVLPASITPDTIEEQLNLQGLTGLIDPPREEARQAVQECKTAGINPVMITGDHPVTAAVIARRLNIIETEDDRIITGAELSSMSDRDLLEIVDDIKVYARVSPEQKLNIVKALQKKGAYVAMTGDGVNDAPALKRADIGVAMGITGTDVAKEAAHMILLDDNFASIVKAVKEGRKIFDNTRRFIRYVLTGNTAEILTIFLAPFFSLPIPLLPIHILWINLVTDGLPGLALTAESAEENIMHRPPRNPKQSIFDDGLGIHVLWVGLLLASLTIGTQAYAIHVNDSHWQTMVFTVLCLGQLTYAMAIRSETLSLFRQGIFSNRALIFTVVITFILQLAIIYFPFLNMIFKTEPLSIKDLVFCIAVSMVVFVVVEAKKVIHASIRSRQ